MPLDLTQLIWLRPGERERFEAFEATVLPLLPRYGGALLLRVRGDVRAAAEGEWIGERPPPDEIHILRFRDEAGLSAFLVDPVRQAALPLKDASVRESVLFRSL